MVSNFYSLAHNAETTSSLKKSTCLYAQNKTGEKVTLKTKGVADIELNKKGGGGMLHR